MAAVIYLHWTATGYDWIRPGHYHSIIGISVSYDPLVLGERRGG